jgi:succinate dehydrogenase / fumarate reductase membrane anchor subunit
MRTSLGRARGLGSAKEGAGHFWLQRITGIGLIPLTLWFAFSCVHVSGLDYAAAKLWLAKPLNATMMILALCVSLWHGVIGCQVVIEDYVHTPALKWSGLIGIRLLGCFLALYIIVAVSKVAFGG